MTAVDRQVHFPRSGPSVRPAQRRTAGRPHEERIAGGRVLICCSARRPSRPWTSQRGYRSSDGAAPPGLALREGTDSMDMLVPSLADVATATSQSCGNCELGARRCEVGGRRIGRVRGAPLGRGHGSVGPFPPSAGSLPVITSRPLLLVRSPAAPCSLPGVGSITDAWLTSLQASTSRALEADGALPRAVDDEAAPAPPPRRLHGARRTRRRRTTGSRGRSSG